MIEDKAQGRRGDHFDILGGSVSNMRSSAGYMTMCILLRRYQRKAEGEVPMLDSLKLLLVRAVVADSLIVDS